MVDLPEGLSLLPDLTNPGACPLSLKPPKPYALLIEPDPLLLTCLVLELYEVLMEGLHILPLLAVVLLDDLLYLFHFLVEHIEQLGILFIFNLPLPNLMAEFFQFFLQMVVLDF